MTFTDLVLESKQICDWCTVEDFQILTDFKNVGENRHSNGKF